MALASKTTNPIQEGVRYLSGSRTGTRTAADFTITLGFTPTHIRVTNLTDRIEALQIVNSVLDSGSNVKGLLQIADGTTTYVDTGITLDDSEKSFTVDVSTVDLETANDDVIWEAWG